MQEFKLEIDSDFYQIIISDEEWEGLDGPTEWIEKKLEIFVSPGTYVVGLRVIENDTHNLSLFLHDEVVEPQVDYWDHIVEVPFEAPTGTLDIEEESIEIPSGEYTLRWCIKQIGDEEVKYQIDMWKSDQTETNVIKQIQL